MTRTELISHIFTKKSYLCIGLDPDVHKMPAAFKQQPEAIFEFCAQIIDATHPYCVAYKPNTAFFEQYGVAGWVALEQVMRYIPKTHFIIADAKRGDIGNTASAYAKTFFETMCADAVTVSPYMGGDSVQPFLSFEQKWAIILALTSNAGSQDFQQLRQENGRKLYESVVLEAQNWGSPENTMFVAGATHGSELAGIRRLAPNHFLLVPGVGAQGGSLKEVSGGALTAECGLLVNASRSVLYASASSDFAAAAQAEAHKLQTEMAGYLGRG